MATPLTGLTVESTYFCLIKTGNNAGLVPGQFTVLSDGAGTELPVQVSTDTIKITGTLDTTTGILTVAAPTQGNHAATRLYVDTEIADVTTAYEAADSGLQTQINTNASDITDLQNVDATIFGWTLDGLNLSDSIDIQGANGITVSNNGNNVITIDGSAIQADVDANTSDITALENAVSSISTDVATNTTNIATNATNIASNDTDIAANASAITDLENGVGNVTSFNTLVGDVTISAGTNVSFNTVGQNIEISSTGGGGGSDSFNTFTVPTQPDVVADSGNDTMNFVDGSGISMTTDNTTKTITFNVDGLGSTTLANGNLWLGDSNGVPQETQRITINNLPTITNDYVWKGGAGGTPVAVNQNTLSVASALNATDSANIKVDSITSGTYRLLVSDTGLASGAYTRAKSDVADGLTYNTTGDVLSTGAFSATNNVTAGGALIGASLDISGGADIDGTLTLGAIGNVEGEINDLNTFVANYNEFSQIVTETASVAIGDSTYSTYKGKTIIMTSSSVLDFELDFSGAPELGDEIYIIQGGTGKINTAGIAPNTIVSAVGNDPSTRAQWSGMVVKYIGNDTWVAMGDIE